MFILVILYQKNIHEVWFKGTRIMLQFQLVRLSAHSIVDSVMLDWKRRRKYYGYRRSEAAICPMGVGGFNSMKALSTRNDDPQKLQDLWKKPWRICCGEKGEQRLCWRAWFVKARGAKIYAEIQQVRINSWRISLQNLPEGEGVKERLLLRYRIRTWQ